MNKIENLWVVAFCPETNQFDIDSVWRNVQDNFEIIKHREDIAKQDHWLMLFVHEDIKECQKFIDAIKPHVKTGNTPLENWYIENGYFPFSKN